jgi:hypothetical protein
MVLTIAAGSVRTILPNFLAIMGSLARAKKDIAQMRHMFGKIESCKLEAACRVIKICGFLMQTKVHLFWKKELGSTIYC